MAGPLDQLLAMLGGTPEAVRATLPQPAAAPSALQQLAGMISGMPSAWSEVQASDERTRALIDQKRYGDATLQGLDNPMANAFVGGAIGRVPPIRAYHGSPHSFDKFDLSKIGTGEGAQAYGHGLYFAEAEPVARGYRDALSNPVMHMDPVRSVWDMINNSGWSKQQVIDHFNMMINKSQTRALDTPFFEKAIDVAESGAWRDYKPSKGHMYEVDIHADPRSLLDWDKPLSAQAPDVQRALKSLGGGFNAYGLDDISLSLLPGQTPVGRHAYQQVARASTPDYEAAQVAASQVLNEAGIPGIRYLDQGSRGTGQGTSNYAIWNDQLIEILRKYGLLPPLAAGGAALEMSQPQEPVY